MSRGHDRGRLDWLVETAGAVVPATAAAYAALRLAPTSGWSIESAVLVAFGATFAVAFTAMRLIPPEARRLALPSFEQPELIDDASHSGVWVDDDELLLTIRYVEWPELMLDQPIAEPFELAAVAELLLDDPLPAPEPDSRVVQLFAGSRMPTAGQLQQRIDRHLAGGEQTQATNKDASDALGEALAELRRSLRQA